MGALDDLAEATTALRRLRERVSKQVEYRDEQVRNALAAGATWRQVQAVSGLTPHAIDLARKRQS